MKYGHVVAHRSDGFLCPICGSELILDLRSGRYARWSDDFLYQLIESGKTYIPVMCPKCGWKGWIRLTDAALIDSVD